MADYKSLEKLKVTVDVSPVVDPITGAVSFTGDNIQPVVTGNVNVLAAIREIVSEPEKAKDPRKITTTGGSSHSSRGGKSKRNRKSKGGKSKKARKSLRRR